MQASAGCQTLDRLYLRTLALQGQCVASEYGRTIYKHSAGAARSLIACDFCATQLKVVTQQFRKGREGRYNDINRLNIDPKRQTTIGWLDFFRIHDAKCGCAVVPAQMMNATPA